MSALIGEVHAMEAVQRIVTAFATDLAGWTSCSGRDSAHWSSSLWIEKVRPDVGRPEALVGCRERLIRSMRTTTSSEWASWCK